jgi:hypothetical protein
MMIAATLVLAGSEVARGNLHALEMPKLKDTIRKRIERSGLGSERFLGVVEVSLGVGPQGTPVWVPHLHAVIASNDLARIRDALSKAFPWDPLVPRPVMVKPVTDLMG